MKQERVLVKDLPGHFGFTHLLMDLEQFREYCLAPSQALLRACHSVEDVLVFQSRRQKCFALAALEKDSSKPRI